MNWQLKFGQQVEVVHWLQVEASCGETCRSCNLQGCQWHRYIEFYIIKQVIYHLLVYFGVWDLGQRYPSSLRICPMILPPNLCSVCFITFLDSSKANLILDNFNKKLGFSQTPPPGWDKIPSLSKELIVGLPLIKDEGFSFYRVLFF